MGKHNEGMPNGWTPTPDSSVVGRHALREGWKYRAVANPIPAVFKVNWSDDGIYRPVVGSRA